MLPVVDSMKLGIGKLEFLPVRAFKNNDCMSCFRFEDLIRESRSPYKPPLLRFSEIPGKLCGLEKSSIGISLPTYCQYTDNSHS